MVDNMHIFIHYTVAKHELTQFKLLSKYGRSLW